MKFPAKRYNTATTNTRSENYGPESTSAGISHETDENEEIEMRTATPEEVKEQIKSFIAPPTKQLEDMTQLVQVVSESLPKGEYQ